MKTLKTIVTVKAKREVEIDNHSWDYPGYFEVNETISQILWNDIDATDIFLENDTILKEVSEARDYDGYIEIEVEVELTLEKDLDRWWLADTDIDITKYLTEWDLDNLNLAVY
jgi:hypothetical protein